MNPKGDKRKGLEKPKDHERAERKFGQPPSFKSVYQSLAPVEEFEHKVRQNPVGFSAWMNRTPARSPSAIMPAK